MDQEPSGTVRTVAHLWRHQWTALPTFSENDIQGTDGLRIHSLSVEAIAVCRAAG